MNATSCLSPTAGRLWVLLILGQIFVPTLRASAQQAPVDYSTHIPAENSPFHRTWQIGGYVQGGFAPGYVVGNLNGIRYQKTQEFYDATFEVGRILTATHGPRILKGRAETLFEITPFWLTHSPKQTSVVRSNNPFLDGRTGTFPGYNVYGASFTPLLLRWNFMHHDSNRQIPWVQFGAGVLWTNQIFPQGYGYPGSYTSNFNFTPQVGIGENLFVKKNQSLNVGVRVMQYNNAGLGEINPVPYTLNFSVGYSWWK